MTNLLQWANYDNNINKAFDNAATLTKNNKVFPESIRLLFEIHLTYLIERPIQFNIEPNSIK